MYNLSVSCIFLDALASLVIVKDRIFLDALASLVILKDPNSASIGRISILFLIRFYPWVCTDSYTISLYPIVSMGVYR